MPVLLRILICAWVLAWAASTAHGGIGSRAAAEIRSKAYWTLQDAGGDVVAVCDSEGPSVATGLHPTGAGGVGVGPATAQTGQVVAQYLYDAYGAVLVAEDLEPHPSFAVGHKGLFADRLDEGITTSGTDPPSALVPFAHTIVQAGNRVYTPQLGRWMQRDPNATAQVLLSAAAHSGRTLLAAAAAFDADGRMGDGFNLYAYLGSNPWMRSDPLGLSYDPFADHVDNYLAEDAGSKAAFLNSLGSDAAAIAVVTATIASYLPFPGASMAGEAALVALGEQDASQFAVAAGLGMVPGGKLAHLFAQSGAGKLIAKIGTAAWTGAKNYVGRSAGWLAGKLGGGMLGLADKAKSWISRKKVVAGACGCFAAGTTVWAPTGLVPIDTLRVGDEVYARPSPDAELEVRRVSAVFVVADAALVQVSVQREDATLARVATTDEHPFWVLNRGWTRGDRLRVGDVLAAVEGQPRVSAVAFTSTRVTVYNVAVDGVPTYLVGADGILVHNCAFTDALGDHVVNVPHHNWSKMFGRKPQLDEVRGILMDVARTGTAVGEQAHQKGISHRFEKVVNGATVWADVFLDEATNTLRVMNGGIK